LDTDQPPSYSLQFVPGEGNANLKIVPAHKTKMLTHIGQWCMAFATYMAVYTDKYPGHIKTLLTYEAKIKNMAHRGGDWLRYDIQFRKLRQSQPIPWDKPHMELWVDCLTSPATNFRTPFNRSSSFQNNNRQQGSRLQNHQSFRNNQVFHNNQPSHNNQSFRRQNRNNAQTNRSEHPHWSCYTYHDTGKCTRTGCNFSHTCYKCHSTM
jgi:hypothetical protein